MVEMTMRVPDSLAPRLRRMDMWLPTVLELSLAGFKTPAAQAAAELIGYLSKGPSSKQVAEYKISAQSQQRLRRLLALNQSGLLSVEEQAELNEIEALEHLIVMLKVQAREQMARKGQ
ncbi:hypothetical protein GW866_02705 [bacterium]|nr:hypothetical protein [bacterium]OIO85729.1 MAG: hypothetical protein AUK02_06385 [Anaerolineae bacterium CG2_30_58_95]PIU91145.1 MAG: hypothetical protein COS63_01770 [Anaerolineae bacterium CG06_land_8_20_14_3_00_57_67]PIW20828.1 MAG: hypothetical protein COW33_01050 [Anaerolineae bacterium CG17_big_fil_post_rev_8_21_14_2_50_57_27]PIX47475.1 MAG: hypothetical protein COZ54_01250 [Anaerolineae bacterium CG_4_8_14_3_um_filter_59_70]PIZ25988.1 MAG: hypothetical protein COY47_02955 [Chloroflex